MGKAFYLVILLEGDKDSFLQDSNKYLVFSSVHILRYGIRYTVGVRVLRYGTR